MACKSPRLLLAGFLLLVACKDNSTPGSPPPGSPGSETVTGTERIGWVQPIETYGDLGRLQYALYVDGGRRILQGETCDITPGGADCSAPLPPLSPGRHTLEVAAFVTSGNELIEGPRSTALTVNVAAIAAAMAPRESPVPAVEDGSLVASDGQPLESAVLARDLTDPVDVAVAPGPTIFVGQRNGIVRTIDGASTGDRQPIQENVLALFPDGPMQNSALLSIAAPPDHPRTGHLHLLYSSLDRDQPVVRLARVRLVNGAFGEAAVLASFPVSGSEVAATLRFGPDGKQYIGLGSVDEPDAAQNLSAPAGKILRLDADGRTPHDNPSASPVLTLGHRDPRGLAWLDGSMWEVERGESGDELNRIRASANYGWPRIETEGRGGLAAPAMSLAGPALSGVAAPDSTSALGGDLVVAALTGEDLFRVRIGRDGRPRVVSRLLQRRFGRIAQVAAGNDGALYFVTANAGPGEPHEALIRLTVHAPRALAGAHRDTP